MVTPSQLEARGNSCQYFQSAPGLSLSVLVGEKLNVMIALTQDVEITRFLPAPGNRKTSPSWLRPIQGRS